MTTPEPPTTPAASGQVRAGRREWLGLAVLALPCMLVTMDLTVLNLALPEVSEDLRPTSSQLLWIVDIYGFLVAGCLITMGVLGDRIGRRRLLMIGAAAFGAASIAAAFSTSAEMLIVTRALLGVAGATLAPSTLSLIRNMFHDAGQRSVAIGVWTASFAAGAALGPVVGGVLLEFFWWGSVFLLAVPVMVLLLIAGPLLLPEFRDPHAGRIDLPSAVLSLAAVLAAIHGIKESATHGWHWEASAYIAAGVLAGVLFIVRQRRLTHPLVDLRLFRVPAFSAAVSSNMIGLGVVFGAYLFMAQYLQLVIGLSPLEAGLWSLPSALAMIVGSMSTPALLGVVRPATVLVGGFLILAAGVAGLVLVDGGGDGALATLVLMSVVFALGASPVFTVATDVVVGAAPPERAGAAAAISETGSEFGGALGIAVLGSIGASVYRDRVADGLPGAVPPEAADAARDTLGGAVAVSEELPAQLAGAVAGAAQSAFADALHVVAVTGAGVAVVAALVIGAALRGRHPQAGAAAVRAD